MRIGVIMLFYRMSANTSPARFIESDDTYLSDANFKADISRKMRVPNKISMGDYDGEIPNGWSNNYSNINMQVPERILVAGQDQHIGKIIYYILLFNYLSLYLHISWFVVLYLGV